MQVEIGQCARETHEHARELPLVPVPPEPTVLAEMAVGDVDVEVLGGVGKRVDARAERGR